jgi:hypothetical protein
MASEDMAQPGDANRLSFLYCWVMRYFTAALSLAGLLFAVAATHFLAKYLGWGEDVRILCGVGAFCVWLFLVMGRSS